MSDVKRLLAEATPLPWQTWDTSLRGLVGPDGQDVAFYLDPPDSALILHAVNRLPDYDAAVDALERLCFGPSDDTTWAEARAALARLREKVPS